MNWFAWEPDWTIIARFRECFPRTETLMASDDMISIVGRWTASAAVILGSKGLLTDDEQDLLRIFFEEQTGLLR